MGLLTIKDSRLAGMTLLPDDFIDYYMPRANGEFVKIYLFLLRKVHTLDTDQTLSSLADVFTCTEKDVLRALRYWEKAGLLSLSFRNRELSGIELLPITPNLQATSMDPDDETDKEEPAAPPKEKVTAQISVSRMKELKSDEEARQILFFTEQYIGHPLSATDMRRILYFYDELHFPADLIDYMVEYCVSKGGRSMNYIEKVGLAWQEEGLLTVKAAKEYNNIWKNKYFAIFRAFGIRGRKPIPDETAVMDRWLTSYGFSIDLIKEAASRTVRQTGQPSFPYAERILSDWHEAHVTSLEDVAALDARHQTDRASGKQSSGSSERKNSFNDNFVSRSYDYHVLERQVLDSQKKAMGHPEQDPGEIQE